jgi:hypothetical protein
MALAWALGGCVDTGDSGGLALRSLLPWGNGTEAAPPDPEETGRQAARSIWGVVPDAPRRKADLRPELIRGSAVAVSGDAMLTGCRVVAGRPRVGLVRHDKYRIARVAAVDEGRHVCRLTVAGGPLNPVAGYRTFEDLRVGEPVVAIASRTSAEVALAPGWLAGKGSAADPFLETTSVLPPGAEGAVLVDARGNLIGVGSAGPLADSVLMAVPLPPAAAPALANRDLGDADVLIASLAASPRERPRLPAILLTLRDNDRGDDAGSLFAARSATPAAEGRREPPAAGPAPGSGPTPDGASGGAGSGGAGSGGAGSGGAGSGGQGAGGSPGADPGGPGAGPSDGGGAGDPGGGTPGGPSGGGPSAGGGDGGGGSGGPGAGGGGNGTDHGVGGGVGGGRDNNRGRGVGGGRDSGGLGSGETSAGRDGGGDDGGGSGNGDGPGNGGNGRGDGGGRGRGNDGGGGDSGRGGRGRDG